MMPALTHFQFLVLDLLLRGCGQAVPGSPPDLIRGPGTSERARFWQGRRGGRDGYVEIEAPLAEIDRLIRAGLIERLPFPAAGVLAVTAGGRAALAAWKPKGGGE